MDKTKKTNNPNKDDQTKIDNGETKKTMATILFANIDGYSLIMQKDEQYGLHLLKTFKKLASQLTQKHQGVLVKEMGDGFVAMFTDAGAALSFALEYQYALIAEQIPARIGINSGDVTISDQNVYGNGVHMAARIEEVAKAGGVYFSQNVADSVQGRNAFKVVALGKFNLKNFHNPAHLYALDHEGLKHHQNQPNEKGFFGQLFWIPREELADTIIKAGSGATLFGAVSLLYGAIASDDNLEPSHDPDASCGGVADHLSNAINHSYEQATSVQEDMSFSEAFAAAREEVGPGGFFEWHGNIYNTYTQSEYESLTPEELTSFIDYIEEAVVQFETETEELLDVQSTLQMEHHNLDTDDAAEALVFTDGDEIVMIQIDSNGNDTFDLTITDTNGDGQLDTIGHLTTDGALTATQPLETPISPDAFLDMMSAEGDQFDVYSLVQSTNQTNNNTNNQDPDPTNPDGTEPYNEEPVNQTNNDTDNQDDVLVSPDDVEIDPNQTPIGPQDDPIYYNEALYNQDIPGMTSNYDTEEWGDIVDTPDNSTLEETPPLDVQESNQEAVNTPTNDLASESTDSSNSTTEEEASNIEQVSSEPALDVDSVGPTDSHQDQESQTVLVEQSEEEEVAPTISDQNLEAPDEVVVDPTQTPIGPQEEVATYDEELYNEDIPGMTNNDDIGDWDGLADAPSDMDLQEAYVPDTPEDTSSDIANLMNDPSVVDMADANDDGVPDEYLADINQDGYAETIAIDHNQNGTPEEFIIDTDMDGEADTIASDFDEDGTIDQVI